MIVSIALFQQVHAIVIIGNERLPVGALSQEQVQMLYNLTPVEVDGESLTPIDLNLNSDVSQSFYQEVLGKSVIQITQARSKLLFSSGANNILVANTPEDAIEMVQANKNYIAYLAQPEKLPNGVKILYQTYAATGGSINTADTEKQNENKKEPQSATLDAKLAEVCAHGCSQEQIQSITQYYKKNKES
ncbi:hypothetical protein IB691_11340 [Fangia hongkongensis]|nr:hypothetical protein [Fangia hongkongensis]